VPLPPAPNWPESLEAAAPRPVARAFGRPRLRGRSVALTFSCRAAATGPCAVGLAAATVRGRGRPRARPPARVRLAAGRRRTLRVWIPYRRLRLVRRGALRVRARVDLGQGWGAGAAVRRR